MVHSYAVIRAGGLRPQTEPLPWQNPAGTGQDAQREAVRGGAGRIHLP